MKYLTKFFDALRGYTVRQQEESRVRKPLPDRVDQQERLTRFLKTKRHFKRAALRVAKEAFMPKTGETELSVFRTSNLSDDEVWEIGESIIRNTERTVYGGANLIAVSVLGLGLGLRADKEPSRHASITGFPVEKYERQDIANELAAASVLVLKSRYSLSP